MTHFKRALGSGNEEVINILLDVNYLLSRHGEKPAGLPMRYFNDGCISVLERVSGDTGYITIKEQTPDTQTAVIVMEYAPSITFINAGNGWRTHLHSIVLCSKAMSLHESIERTRLKSPDEDKVKYIIESYWRAP